MSPFAAEWRALSERGYHVLPIGPDTKAPSEYRGGRWRGMNDWQSFRVNPAGETTAKVWASWPDANIGVLTGTATSDGHVLACVDLDTDDADQIDALQSALPLSPVHKRGRRGYSAFYQVAKGTAGFRTPLVELLTDTRQTVVPGSIHPDTGRPYVWCGRETLMDVAAADLPVLNEDDLERFRDTLNHLLPKPAGELRSMLMVACDDDAPIQRRLNTAAVNDPDRWFPDLGLPKTQRLSDGWRAVASWRPSARGRLIARRNPNLKLQTGNGARDHGTGESYSPLNLVMAAFDIDLDGAFQWLGGRMGFVEEALPMVRHVPPHDPETGEILEGPVSPNDKKSDENYSDELPDRLTRVPGLVGDMVNWIEASARRPNRTLALGTALTVLGTLMGQAVAGPTRAGTHLYVVCLAPSGAGKDHPLQCVNRLLRACNSASLIGPSEFISMPAVIKLLMRKPLALCAMDELGAFFKRLIHPRASAYEKSITKVLRSAWGLNFESMMTPEWANMKSEEIVNPALSIYGVSTPEEFFASLEGDDVINGFLNRWLLLTTAVRPRDRNPHVPREVPDALALALVEFRNWACRNSSADLKSAVGASKTVKEMVWNGGWAGYQALVDDVEAMADQPDIAPYYARTPEMALRLATIVTAGQGKMDVDADAMAWAWAVARWSADRMVALATSHIADNDTQRLHNKIVRTIAKRGGKCSHRDLLRALQGGVKSQDLKSVMDNLLGSGELVAHKTTPPAGGTPTITYELLSVRPGRPT